MDSGLLHGVLRPRRHQRLRCNERHLFAGGYEKLRECTPHVVVIVVEQHHAVSFRKPSAQEIIGRQHLETFGYWNRLERCAPYAVGAPACPCGDGDVIEVVTENLLGSHRASSCELDILQAPQLSESIVHDPDPSCQPR